VSHVIKGSFPLTGRIFERWSDSKSFSDDFEQMAEILSLRSGLDVSIDSDRLTVVHELWISSCDAWLQLLLPHTTKRLSHLKMSAILLEKLCELSPITVTGSIETTQFDINIQDAGHSPDDLPNQMSRHDKIRLRDGGTHYVGWLISYHICRHFEAERIDRIDVFCERITEEFESDTVSALLSGRVSAQAIHIIFKALFLRD
jgi:hypothetical protein